MGPRWPGCSSKARPTRWAASGRGKGSDSAGAVRLLDEQDEVQLAVLGAQPADEEAEEVGEDDLPDPVVLVHDAAEIAGREHAEPRRRDRLGGGRADLVVDRPVLAEAAAG